MKIYSYSGTVLDLPYRFGADEDAMHLDQGFSMPGLLMDNPGAAIALCACLMMMLGSADFD